MAPTSLATAIGRIYAAAAEQAEPTFLCDHLSTVLKPAIAVLRNGSPDAHRRGLDPSRHMSASVLRDGTTEISVDVSRPENIPGFTDADISLFDTLVPHLRRAMRMRRDLARAELRWRRISEVADRLDAAVITLDAVGRIVFTNRRANEYLASGEPFVVQEERLRATADEQQEDWDRALTRALPPAMCGKRLRPRQRFCFAETGASRSWHICCHCRPGLVGSWNRSLPSWSSLWIRNGSRHRRRY